jgi:hypothetical protein
VNTIEASYVAEVANLGCCVCRRLGYAQRERTEVHHVAAGSGKRSEYAIAPLCTEHHRGKSGLHGMGPKAFIRLYRPPGDSEYGLLVWVAEDLSRARHAQRRAA